MKPVKRTDIEGLPIPHAATTTTIIVRYTEEDLLAALCPTMSLVESPEGWQIESIDINDLVHEGGAVTRVVSITLHNHEADENLELVVHTNPV